MIYEIMDYKASMQGRAYYNLLKGSKMNNPTPIDLSAQEIEVLIAIMRSQSADNNSPVLKYHIDNLLQNADPTDIAFHLLRLAKKQLIQKIQSLGERDDISTTPTYALTSNGDDWVLENEQLIRAKILPKDKDVPF